MTDYDPVDRGNDEDKEMFISVSSNGMFYIPDRVYERYFGGHPNVAVGKNVEQRRIALKPTDEEPSDGPDGENVYELSDNRGFGKRFNCLKALTALDIDLDNTVRLDPTWDEDMDAVVLSFEEEEE